jgi:hypothetical protein
MPNYRRILYTMIPVTIFMAFACGSIFRNPSTSSFCWFLQIPGSVMSNVEEKNCVILVDGYVTLSIATGFTAFICLMSTLIVVYQSMRKGRVMLPDEPSSGAQPGEIEDEK